MEYPVQFSVDYPDRPLDRLSTAFRLVAVIPVAIVLAAVLGGTVSFPSDGGGVVYVFALAGGRCSSARC